MVSINLYQDSHQPQIDELMKEINDEFILEFTHLTYIPKTPDKYWVALYSDNVVGTIAVNYEIKYAVLKKLFLKKTFRGKGIADLLFQAVLGWCKKKNVDIIYLGTLQRFVAAQKFYEKNGFIKISKNELPSNFSDNPIDEVFYKLILE